MAAQFPLDGEPLVIDLLNTRVREGGELVELLAGPDDLTAWLRRHRGSLPEVPGSTTAAVAGVRSLREAARRLLDALQNDQQLDERDVALLNDHAAAAPAAAHLINDDGHLAVQRDGSGTADEQLLGRLAEATIEFLVSPDAHRVRHCEGPGCVLMFLPTHHARRWCSSTTCGNRVRVARHYQQRKQRPRP